MNTKKSRVDAHLLPEHESGVRRLIADSTGLEYQALSSLEAARTFEDATLVMEGDHGGQIYLVAPVSQLKCSEDTLRSLLLEIDAIEWNDPEGASLFFERLPVGSGVPGGMGGAIVRADTWVHERLQAHRSAIIAVLSGNQASIRQ